MLLTPPLNFTHRFILSTWYWWYWRFYSWSLVWITWLRWPQIISFNLTLFLFSSLITKFILHKVTYLIPSALQDYSYTHFNHLVIIAIYLALKIIWLVHITNYLCPSILSGCGSVNCSCSSLSTWGPGRSGKWCCCVVVWERLVKCSTILYSRGL